MKKVFHKLRDYVLALLALMTISACSDSLNTLNDPHFTEEGTLVKKPSLQSLIIIQLFILYRIIW